MSGRGQTPRRTTRATTSRANTPAGALPALPTNYSSAYGSMGKATLQSQVTTSQATLDKAFTSTSRASREPTTTRRSTRQKKTQSVVEEEPEPEPESEPEVDSNDATVDEPEDETVDERPGTSLQDSALYAQQQAALQAPAPHPPQPRQPQPAPPQRAPRPPRNPTVSPPAPVAPPRRQTLQNQTRRDETPPRRDQYEPPIWRILVGTLRKFILPWSLIFLFGVAMFVGFLVLGLLCYAAVPLHGHRADVRDTFFKGQKISLGLQGPPEHVEAHWHQLKHKAMWEAQSPEFTNITVGAQYLINAYLLQHLNDTENEVASQGEAIQEIQRLLPHGLALEEQNGEWVIPTRFWDALLDKVSNPGAASVLWDRFMTANKRQITEFQENIAHGAINEMISSNRLLVHSQLQDALLANRRLIEASFDEKMAQMKAEIIETTKEMFTRDPANLARWNIAYAMEQRLHERNYVSPSFGALVDPYITSTTFKELTTFQHIGLYALWATGLSRFGLIEMPKNPPVAALTSWEEATQCWCSAHNSDSKAQLGIQLAHKIHPDTLFIEHVPSDGTLDIAAAPRTWEMWVQLEDETKASQFQAIVNMRATTYNARRCSGEGPDKSWLCLATGEYDIHSPMYIQSTNVDFALDTDVESMYTDRVVFKVKDNWGAEDHTCIYRVRLTGTPRADYKPRAPSRPAI